MNFDTAFDRLIGNEGGLVDDPEDPGRLTKYGISQRSYPKLDITNLTLDQAKAIYLRDFWTKAACDLVLDAIRFDLFDTAVNSGATQAIKLVQRAVYVTADGVIGPNTLTALKAADPLRTIMRFNANRLALMVGLKNWPAHSRGWVLRVVDNLLEA